MRIARELHDLVSHHLVVVVSAQAAQQMIEHDPVAARQVMATVETSGREVLQEMRTLLGVLRASGDTRVDDPAPGTGDDEDSGGAIREVGAEDAGFAPTPGLTAVEQLISQARATGLQVTVQATGTPRPLPAPVEVWAYRIVQGALTNTLKHAHGTSVVVRLDYREQELVVTVTDNGPAGGSGAGSGAGHPAGPRIAGSGFGLVGMTERAALLGGRLHAGPGPGGGWQVTARLPLASRPGQARRSGCCWSMTSRCCALGSR